MEFTAKQIAEYLQGRVEGDENAAIHTFAKIEEGVPGAISFLSNPKYTHYLYETKSSIVLVNEDVELEKPVNATLIRVKNAYECVAKLLQLYESMKPKKSGIDPLASISPKATIGENVYVGAFAVIGDGAVIGNGTQIYPHTVIGDGVTIGENGLLYPNVTVMYRCIIGRKAVIHPGVVIGADGFGFIPGPQGLVKVPQTGYVQIDDDVEIGANTTIDRARFGKTWIKSNVKIDNQVMVAHNVTVGESSILVAQCGIAGSSELGRGVILAAQSGVNGHITLGDGVQVAGTSGVLRSVPAGKTVLGTPAETQREFMARYSLPSRFEKLSRKVAELQAELDALKAAAQNESK